MNIRHAVTMASVFGLAVADLSMAGFTTDEELTCQGSPLTGDSMNARMAWNPVTGKIGLIYVNKAVLTYAEWASGSGIVLKEKIADSCLFPLGLAYDGKGLPRTGCFASLGPGALPYSLCEYVKQGTGTWALTDTGINPGARFYFAGTYAYNPKTQTGAFFVSTGMKPEVTVDEKGSPLADQTYIYYQGGKWQTLNCGNGSYSISSLAFTTNGDPIVLWDDAKARQRMAGLATPGSQTFFPLTDTVVQEINPMWAEEKVTVDPSNGDVWMAYLAERCKLVCRKWTGSAWGVPEEIDWTTAYQMTLGVGSQLGFALSPSGDKAVLYPTVTGLRIAYYSHAAGRWSVETVTTEPKLSADIAFDKNGKLYGLYNSDDTKAQFHMLSDYVPPTPLYLKIKVGPEQKVPFVVHMSRGLTGNIYKDVTGGGYHPDEAYTGYPGTKDLMLTANTESPWIDMAPYLHPGNNFPYFQAMQNWHTGGCVLGLPESSYTVLFSTTKSDAGIVKTATRSGRGGGFYFIIDPAHPGQIQSDVDGSQMAYNVAHALSPTPGKRPAKFPITTGCGVGCSVTGPDSQEGYAAMLQPTTISNEVGALSALGYNGCSFGEQPYEPTFYKHGFTKLEYQAGCSSPRKPWAPDYGDLSLMDTALATAMFTPWVQYVTGGDGHAADLVRWTLHDEPGSMSMDAIVQSPPCHTAFRTYLQGLGLTPGFFGQNSWEGVNPETDKIKHPKEFYYTTLFRGWLLTNSFKIETTVLSGLLPGARTSASFAEEATFFGNAYRGGVDFFDIYAKGALTMGWCEEWGSYASTYQICGYRADLLRGACSAGNYPFGMYCVAIGRPPWDVEAKAVTEIGHGAQALCEYNYGPFYTGFGDYFSTDTNLYQGLRQVNYAIGGVEDYLVGATVPKAKIALLYSRCTDIWTLDQEYSAFGKDRMGIYLILRHLGYPVDILCEQDVVDGKLSDYKMLVCDGSHCESSMVTPLVHWLNAGGILYLGAGALTCDQFNNPLGFDPQVGIARQAYQHVQSPGSEMYAFPALTNQQPVTYDGDAMESLCGYQKGTATGATVLATFNGDGSPALFTKAVGSGRLAFCGFFPGLAYEKQGMLTRKTRDASNPNFPTCGSTDWPAAYRALFSALIGSAVTVPVTTGNYLVEANRIETSRASVITLSNWSGAPLKKIKVVLPRQGMKGAPKTVINPILRQTTTSGMLTVTMNMDGPIDFLVLPAAR